MSGQSGTRQPWSVESKVATRSLPPPEDFSVVLGGLLFQLLRRAHLSDDALTQVRQRIIVIALLLGCRSWCSPL